MLYHYIIGVGAVLLISMAWLGVQRAWKRSFPDALADPDALAGRSGCHGCHESKDCHQRLESGACKTKETP
jgi:hypothetical protein